MLVSIALLSFMEILIFDFQTVVLMLYIQSVSTSRSQWISTDNFINVLSMETGDFLRFDFRFTVHSTILPVLTCIDSYWTICTVYYRIYPLPSSCDLFCLARNCFMDCVTGWLATKVTAWNRLYTSNWKNSRFWKRLGQDVVLAKINAD